MSEEDRLAAALKSLCESDSPGPQGPRLEPDSEAVAAFRNAGARGTFFLVRVLKAERDIQQSRAAIALLGLMGDPHAAEPLTYAARKPELAAAALHALMRLNVEEAHKTILFALDSDDEEVRTAARSALKQAPLPEDERVLCEIAATEGHPMQDQARTKAAAAIAARLPRAMKQLNVVDYPKRCQARAVVVAAGKVAIPGVMALLKPWSQPRKEGQKTGILYTTPIEVLGELRDPRAVNLLAGIIQYGARKECRLAALEALGKIGGSRAFFQVKKLTRHVQKDIALSAIEALGLFGRAGVAAARPFLNKLPRPRDRRNPFPPPSVQEYREAAIGAFKRAGDAAIPELVRAANTRAAIARLGEIGTPAALKALEKLAVKPPNIPGISSRAEILKAISAIGGQEAVNVLLGLMRQLPPDDQILMGLLVLRVAEKVPTSHREVLAAAYKCGFPQGLPVKSLRKAYYGVHGRHQCLTELAILMGKLDPNAPETLIAWVSDRSSTQVLKALKAASRRLDQLTPAFRADLERAVTGAQKRFEDEDTLWVAGHIPPKLRPVSRDVRVIRPHTALAASLGIEIRSGNVGLLFSSSGGLSVVQVKEASWRRHLQICETIGYCKQLKEKLSAAPEEKLPPDSGKELAAALKSGRIGPWDFKVASLQVTKAKHFVVETPYGTRALDVNRDSIIFQVNVLLKPRRKYTAAENASLRKTVNEKVLNTCKKLFDSDLVVINRMFTLCWVDGKPGEQKVTGAQCLMKGRVYAESGDGAALPVKLTDKEMTVQLAFPAPPAEKRAVLLFNPVFSDRSIAAGLYIRDGRLQPVEYDDPKVLSRRYFPEDVFSDDP